MPRHLWLVFLVASLATFTRADEPSPVERLPGAEARQIFLQAEVVEISRTKLRTLGFDFAAMDKQHSSLQNSTVATLAQKLQRANGKGPGVDRYSAFLGFLDALRADDMARSLAKHELKLVPGEPGKIRQGKDVPTSTVFPQITDKNFTTFLGDSGQYVANVDKDGTIHLDVQVEVNKLRDEIKPTQGEKVPAKVFHVEFASSMKLEPGTYAFASQQFTHKSKVVRKMANFPFVRNVTAADEEVEVVMIVTAEQVDGKVAELPTAEATRR